MVTSATNFSRTGLSDWLVQRVSAVVLLAYSLFVFGVFILRFKKLNIAGAYKTAAYPVAPIIYLSVTLWTLAYVLISRPTEALIGLEIIAVGGLIYFLSANKIEQDSGR